MPTVSIIIPVYNSERYLRPCLDSVLGQTFGDFEVIAVDDGSTDGSGAILDEVAAADSRLRVIHRPNGGPSAARNDALECARGRYFMFVDSDDLLYPDSLETLMAGIADCDVTVGGFTIFDDGTEPQRKRSDATTAAYSGIEAVALMLYQTNPDINTSASGKLFRRELFDVSEFEEGLLYEDTELIPRIVARAGRVVYRPVDVYCYRMRPGSILATFGPKRFDVLRSCERLVSHFADNPALERAARDRLLSAAFNMLLLMGRHRYDDPAERTRCEAIVRANRRATLTNPAARPKNRIAALLTYLIGLRPFSAPLFGRLFLTR